MQHEDSYGHRGAIIRTWRCCPPRFWRVDTQTQILPDVLRLRKFKPACDACGAVGESVEESEDGVESFYVAWLRGATGFVEQLAREQRESDQKKEP